MLVDPTLKTCSKCKATKALTEFCKDRQKRTGIASHCRECQSLAHAKYRAENPEAVKAKGQRDRANLDPKKRNEYARQWRAANPSKVSEYRARHRALHPDAQKAGSAKYRATHRDRVRAATLKWSHENAERHRENGRRWDKANPDKLRERAARRRVAIRSGPVERINLATIYARDKGLCGVCGKAVAFEKASLDHVLPVSRGGGHVSANVRITHLRCNIQRGNRGTAQLRMLG